jgi:DNA polymerase III subunit epsilon
MMQGDFPLYTKRKLEEIYSRWNAKRTAEKHAKAAPPKPVEAPKVENKPPVTPIKVEAGEKSYSPKLNYNQPNDRKPFVKKDEQPAKPVNEDMLKMLADKFKKG